ncbi:unnamed protein product [Microthlaspi erraticum]|uniref:AAA+ ATPase domain-containing protein n=1 Tax=Microthlaspi erraticum TaxID=1685480 RepID=A0A6D2JGN3_9BRAS|nr:unnamed protein product [Microthlaspi erraticum]
MEGGEEVSARRNRVIAFYKATLNHRNSFKSFIKACEDYLEVLTGRLEYTGDVLRYLTDTRAEFVAEIVNPIDKERYAVKGDDDAGYVVGCCSKIDKAKLISGTRVTLESETLTIMRILPPKVNPLVYNMLQQECGDVNYSDLGGLSKQIRDLKDWIERPLKDPEIFKQVGVKPPKGVLLYGPPGTGKTLLARAIASNNKDLTFLTVVSSAIVSKIMGNSSLLLREMFKYARDHQPSIIFMDEIDAIGRRRRSSEGEVKTDGESRVLFELLSQLDGYDELEKVKVIMATNRPDVLDPALLRPGRIDKKIKIPLPNGDSRLRILEIHASRIAKQGEIDYENVVRLSEGFNGADMRNICTEAGMFAIRAERDYVVSEDFIKAARKLGEAKKLESNAEYNANF